MISDPKIGCVYFILQKQTNVIKIGYSDNPDPENRLRSLITASPFKLKLIGYILTTEAKTLEMIAHDKFKIHRLSGEWFRVDLDSVIRFITSHINGIIKITLEPSQKSESKFIRDLDELVNNFIFSEKAVKKSDMAKELIMTFPNISPSLVANKIGLSRMQVHRIKKRVL